MRNIKPLKIVPAIALFCFTACSGGSTKNEIPLPGTVLANTSEPITDDSLNKFTFSLKLFVDSTAPGAYDVAVAYGPNTAIGKFTMPKGIEETLPILRKGKTPYTYVVGFKLPDDTAFYEYYEIVGSSSSIRMKYLNSYSFK